MSNKLKAAVYTAITIITIVLTLYIGPMIVLKLNPANKPQWGFWNAFEWCLGLYGISIIALCVIIFIYHSFLDALNK